MLVGKPLLVPGLREGTLHPQVVPNTSGIIGKSQQPLVPNQVPAELHSILSGGNPNLPPKQLGPSGHANYASLSISPLMLGLIGSVGAGSSLLHFLVPFALMIFAMAVSDKKSKIEIPKLLQVNLLLQKGDIAQAVEMYRLIYQSKSKEREKIPWARLHEVVEELERNGEWENFELLSDFLREVTDPLKDCAPLNELLCQPPVESQAGDDLMNDDLDRLLQEGIDMTPISPDFLKDNTHGTVIPMSPAYQEEVDSLHEVVQLLPIKKVG